MLDLSSTSAFDINATMEAVTSNPELTTAQSFIHTRPSSAVVWTTGLLFVTLINLCAVVGIAVMKYLTKDTYNRVITLFVGLGVGSLSGSSFYHLLPQAYPQLVNEVDENGQPTHNYLTMAHWSLCGVYMFFLVDKVIKIFLERRKKNRGHRCVHEENTTPRSDAHILLDGHRDGADKREIELQKLESNADKAMVDQGHAVCVHDHTVNYLPGDSPIAAVAWMIIFGDGFHNFIDGISIGASFSESLHSGISVSLAVLCEEFPHELGDVAILVASGMTLRQAFLYNLLSAVTCYLGFIIGVLLGEMGSDVTKYAFALAGGMFLYISLGCMMPEMRKVMEEALNVSFWRGLGVLLLQCVGLFTGITLMYVMARYGEEISI